ncbi:lysylphosphatidylglycerol synthase domain-containing protein [Polymorphospora sp. A560]
MTRRLARLRPLLTAVLVVAILAGVWWTVRGQDWSVARPLVTGHAVPYLLAAAGCNIVALLCAMRSWASTLADLGHRLPNLAAARIYFVGVLAKYVPGRVWVVVTQARLAADAGVPGTATVAAFLLNVVVMLLTGLVVGALAGPAVLGDRGWWLLAPAALVVALLAWPGVVGRLAAVGARLVRRDLPAVGTGTATRAAVGWQLACWLVSGLHLWLLLMALGAPPGPALVAGVGGFALATVLSTLVVVVPDGAVVREVLIAVALVGLLPATGAGAAAIASRAVCLLTELAVAGAVLLGARLARRRHPDRPPTPLPATPVPVTPAPATGGPGTAAGR